MTLLPVSDFLYNLIFFHGGVVAVPQYSVSVDFISHLMFSVHYVYRPCL